jgi:hypothetical protein
MMLKGFLILAILQAAATVDGDCADGSSSKGSCDSDDDALLQVPKSGQAANRPVGFGDGSSDSASFTVTLNSDGEGSGSTSGYTMCLDLDMTCSITNLGDTCWTYNNVTTYSMDGWTQGKQVKDPEYSWSGISGGGPCVTLCEQYAYNNSYDSGAKYGCSYQYDKSTHKCWVAANAFQGKEQANDWKYTKIIMTAAGSGTAAGYAFSVKVKSNAGYSKTKNVCPDVNTDFDDIQTSCGTTKISYTITSSKDPPSLDAGLVVDMKCSYKVR